MDKAYDETLDALTRPADGIPVADGSGAVHCRACAHGCRILPGRRGLCAVRFNRAGHLMVPYGYTSSLAVDPVEKKPFYHVLPGHKALSFGMLGCNLRCRFCQNWSISQVLHDERALVRPRQCRPEALVSAARRSGCSLIASTYNEPLITTEWAATIFRLAKAKGMKTCMISNGFASQDALAYLQGLVDAMNVDLKCYSDAGYRWLGGRLEPVKETIATLWRSGVWVEVITLVVPGFNDTPAELRGAAEFLVGVSPDLPWHVSAFHPDYRLEHGSPATSRAMIETAMAIGADVGLRYVYSGNMPGCSRGADTPCPHCDSVMITRGGHGGTDCRVRADGSCPSCGSRIPGVWSV